MSRKTDAEKLTAAATGHWTKLNYCVHRELGLVPRGRLRADVVAIHHKRKVVVCEVKSSIEDFTTDSKWTKYLDLECFTQFYFVISEATYKDRRAIKMIEAIRHHQIGLMVLDSTTGLLRTKIKCPVRDLDDDKLLDIALRIVWRSGFNKRNTRRTRQYLAGE